MCLSALGQIVYGAVMLVALALTLVAMFTPGWRELKKQTGEDIDDLNIPSDSGLFSSICRAPGDSGAATTDCQDWWNNQPTWNKVVIVCMALAVIIEAIALVWNLITFCACCCKKHILHPLSALASLAAICLGIAVIVFGVNNKDSIKDFTGYDNLNAKNEVNYSFYIACGACGADIIAIFVGVIAACFADRSL